jgi:MFS family permease
MATGFRSLAAVVAAMIVAFVFVVAVEGFSAVVHPLPPDFRGTMEEVSQHVSRYPHWVLAVVVFAWGATAFVSAWIAARIGNRGSALVTGLLLLAALVFNISQLPYPTWFRIVILLVIPAALLCGSRLGIRPKAIGSNGRRPSRLWS